MALKNILPFAHELLAAHISAGDTALDATAGNGHDTAFLAQCVGEMGQVWAFDIQEAALAKTHQRLLDLGLDERVRCVADSHAHLAAYAVPPLAAAVFNCGYLPGGDKTQTTLAATTCQALALTLERLKVGGVLVVVLYSGHEAGVEEAAAVCRWAADLPQDTIAVLRYGFINRRHTPPFLLAFERLV